MTALSPLQTPTHHRALAIETHHTTQRALFLRPLLIHTPLIHPATITLPQRSGPTPTSPINLSAYSRSSAITIPLSALTVPQTRQFLYKDVAMYIAFEMRNNAEPLSIFDEVYRLWWPCRDRERDVDGRWEAFAGKCARFESRVGVREVVGFHRGLVRVLEGLLLEAGREEGLRDSFKECCVVFDREGWRREGVLVVAFGDGSEERIEGEDGVVREREMEGEVGEGVRVWRMGLGRAMRVVVGGERGRRGREWNEMFEEELGGGMEDVGGL